MDNNSYWSRNREKAMELAKNQHFKEALVMLFDLTESNKEDSELFVAMGYCAGAIGDYGLAISSYLKALEQLPKDQAIDPKNKAIDAATICLNLGEIYLRNKNYTEAIEILEIGIKHNPKDANVYNAMGMAYQSLGDLDKALELYLGSRMAMLTNAARWDKESDRVKDLNKMTGHKAIMLDLDKSHSVLGSNPDYSILMENIALIYLKLGDLEEAKDALQESIDFTPEGFDFSEKQEALDQLKSMEVNDK